MTTENSFYNERELHRLVGKEITSIAVMKIPSDLILQKECLLQTSSLLNAEKIHRNFTDRVLKHTYPH